MKGKKTTLQKGRETTMKHGMTNTIRAIRKGGEHDEQSAAFV